MINKLKNFFEENFSNNPDNELSIEEKLHRAAAALLIEISWSDSDISEEEKKILKNHLKQKFALSDSLIDELVEIAEEEVKDVNSSYEFIRLINTCYEKEEKFHLVETMWELAFADGRIDMYEESMIRKLSDLLYVPHSEFIRAKLKAQEKSQTA